MHILLVRDDFTAVRTLGTLTIDGKDFGHVCEDCDRGLDIHMGVEGVARRKIKGRTAIPTGVYAVRRTQSPKYKKLMPLLLGVPGYEGVRIHAGNDADDTEGCLLPGKTRTKDGVATSAKWAEWLDGAIAKAEADGEPVTIEITRDSAAWARRTT
jgi:hypothetical protein